MPTAQSTKNYGEFDLRKAKVSYIPMAGSGALHLDFQPGPFGDATQASSGEGVGFFSPMGDIQGVTFDDVCERSDNQVLEFDGYRLEVSVRRGKVSYQLSELSPPKKPARVVKEKSD